MSGTSSADPPSPSSVLRRHRERILTEWCRLARSLPPAARLSEEALIDHMPMLLDRIGEMADRLARGEAPPPPEREAAKHARQRWRKGFELHQVLREHALLRQVIAGMPELHRPALRCLDQAIDEAMILSAEKFAEMGSLGVHSIVSAIYDGILIVNAAEEVVTVNEGATRVYGMTADEIKGPLADLVGRLRLRTPEGEVAVPIARAALAGEDVPWVERVIVDPESGAERHIRASAAPLRTPDGDVDGAVVVVSDITDRIRSERLREEILAVVSHDLRNPLGAILTSTERLLEGAPEPKAARRLATIHRAAGRMERLIADLLDMASIQAGRLSLELRPTPAPTLVEDALLSHEALAQERGVALHLGPVSEGALVSCDRERISQVFSNLVGNAIKFCEPGDRVTIGAAAGAGEVTFTVADTGPGIAPDDAKHVFKRYWSSAEHARRGTGLGLHISKTIVKAHGGRIWLESEPGHGATFLFTLPLCP